MSSKTSTSEKLSAVELGYVEESEPWRLESHFFPSKVGGLPAWLSFNHIPTSDMVRCGNCDEPCVFLLQVYAPIETGRPSAFHRTIYVFVCRNPECCSTNQAKNFVVLRCQLPRENEFYGSEPLSIDQQNNDGAESGGMNLSIRSIKRQDTYNGNKLCAICACTADKHCGQCKKVSYCSKSHQEIDWKSGGHKNSCGKSTGTNQLNPISFPEFDLVTETERFVEKKPKERSEGERLRDYEDYLANEKTKTGSGSGLTEESVQHLEAMAKTADKDFKLFRRRLEQNPEQVLRYQRGGIPLWADTTAVPREADIPPCVVCGARRIFEFQIMPHLLSHLDVDCVGKSLDWATVAVYTCEDSCDIPDYGYANEWAWKQDYKE